MRKSSSPRRRYELIDHTGRRHRVDGLTLRQVWSIQTRIDASDGQDEAGLTAEILDLLRPGLPPAVMAEAAAWSWPQLATLVLFLAGMKSFRTSSPPGIRGSLRFAAALVLKQFGGYRLSDLRELSMPDFLELYRLAMLAQLDEAAMITARGVTAAFNHRIDALLEQRLAMITPASRVPVEMPSPEELAEARKLAAELSRRSETTSCQPLCTLNDFTSLRHQKPTEKDL